MKQHQREAGDTDESVRLDWKKLSSEQQQPPHCPHLSAIGSVRTRPLKARTNRAHTASWQVGNSNQSLTRQQQHIAR